MLSELKPYISAILFSPALPLIGISAGFFISFYRHKVGVLIGSFLTIMLWIFGTPLFSTWLFNNFLIQYIPVSAEYLKTQNIQAIVVLGGGVSMGQPDGIQQLTSTGLDRLRYGIELSRKTEIPLMVTGGKGWGADENSESESSVSVRVASDAFNFTINLTESNSRDTLENAINSFAFLSTKGINKIALVTHAWHMPRSEKDFKKVGFHVVASPMGYPSTIGNNLIDYIPNSHSLTLTFTIFREKIAMIVQYLKN
jgi:uncharacterized SAM-binding protein YcdF (DUF218 family)